MAKPMVTIKVSHIDTPADLQEAFKIREVVYIDEQKINREDEFGLPRCLNLGKKALGGN